VTCSGHDTLVPIPHGGPGHRGVQGDRHGLRSDRAQMEQFAHYVCRRNNIVGSHGEDNAPHVRK
jgi:hypothetical protein